MNKKEDLSQSRRAVLRMLFATALLCGADLCAADSVEAGESAFVMAVSVIAKKNIAIVQEVPRNLKGEREQPRIHPKMVVKLLEILPRLQSAEEFAKEFAPVLVPPFEIFSTDGVLWIRKKGFVTFAESKVKVDREGDYRAFDLFEKLKTEDGGNGLGAEHGTLEWMRPKLMVHCRAGEIDFPSIVKSCIAQNPGVVTALTVDIMYSKTGDSIRYSGSIEAIYGDGK